MENMENEKVKTAEDAAEVKVKKTFKEELKSWIPPRKGPDGKKPKYTVKQEIMSWIFTFACALAIALVIRTFFLEPVRVDGQSMSNTLLNGEIVLVTKPEYWSGDYKRNDVIICRYPGRGSTLFVKRLIALPGDTIEMRAGVVYINGEMKDESWMDTMVPSRTTFLPYKLGEDEYFVMGDNRGNSNDSRYVGPISSSMIIGHVRSVIWPLSKFGHGVQ